MVLLANSFFEYQPVFHRDGVVFFEALFRVPDKNVNITNLLNTYVNKPYLDMFNLRRIYRDIKDKDIKVSVNISSKSLNYDYFIEELLSINGIKEKIILEITEHDEIIDHNKYIENIILLQKSGFQIALDDFGSGYNNLSLIYQLKFDYIKIDSSIMDFIDKSYQAFKMIESIVIQNRNKSIIIFEGIERVNQVNIIDFLIKKCEINTLLYQGYYFCKPGKLDNMLNEFKNINLNFSQHEGEDVEKINCEYLVYNELSNNKMSVSELDIFIDQYIKKTQYLNDEMRSIFLSENI